MYIYIYIYICVYCKHLLEQVVSFQPPGVAVSLTVDTCKPRLPRSMHSWLGKGSRR